MQASLVQSEAAYNMGKGHAWPLFPRRCLRSPRWRHAKLICIQLNCSTAVIMCLPDEVNNDLLLAVHHEMGSKEIQPAKDHLVLSGKRWPDSDHNL